MRRAGVLRLTVALQAALLVPLVAGAIGLAGSFRMTRLPDPKPSESSDAVVLG